MNGESVNEQTQESSDLSGFVTYSNRQYKEVLLRACNMHWLGLGKTEDKTCAVKREGGKEEGEGRGRSNISPT